MKTKKIILSIIERREREDSYNSLTLGCSYLCHTNLNVFKMCMCVCVCMMTKRKCFNYTLMNINIIGIQLELNAGRGRNSDETRQVHGLIQIMSISSRAALPLFFHSASSRVRLQLYN